MKSLQQGVSCRYRRTRYDQMLSAAKDSLVLSRFRKIGKVNNYVYTFN
jgi:hypothetical protein